MITLKSPHEIELMRRAGKITAAARALAGEMVRPGVTTQEIDRAVEHFIRKEGAVPSFLHYPAAVHHYDFICVAYCAESVRDYYHSPILVESVETGLYKAFIIGIQ